MGGKRIDLTGQVFGRLTVMGFSHCKTHAYWHCSCKCGKVCIVRAPNLKSGNTVSCGCYNREIAKLLATTHGMSSSLDYKIWQAMVQRCINHNSLDYKDYGGRGIVVCDSWLKFEAFYRDMGPRPSKDHSLDRIDNNGPYCKENCRWATKKEQGNNQRSNRLLTHNGDTRTMSEWSASIGIPYVTLQSRIVRGWDVDRALTEPVRKQNNRGGI